MKLAIIAASLFVSAKASASSVGLNFVDIGDPGIQNGTTDALGAAELAGVPSFLQANWNNLGRWGQTVPLIDSTGAATGVTATWDSNNTWRTGVGTATPDHKLMHGYLDSTGQPNQDGPPYQFFNNVNKPEIYVTGLSNWLAGQPADLTRYNVIVYIDGDESSGRIGEYWLQAPGDATDPPQALGADLTTRVFVRDSAQFSGTFVNVPLAANSVATAGDGNYVVFPRLSADSFILRTEERTVRTMLNGVQIVAVPEVRAGDVDGDDDVDFDDFTTIRNNFQTSVTSRNMGDLNEDGFVDFLDFRQWKNNYPSPGAGSGSGLGAAIPEPSSWMLSWAAGILTLARRRQMRRIRRAAA